MGRTIKNHKQITARVSSEAADRLTERLRAIGYTYGTDKAHLGKFLQDLAEVPADSPFWEELKRALGGF